jgi:hypothetical protein
MKPPPDRRVRAEAERSDATPAAIAQRARQLWVDYGRPAGRDEQIWLEAERQLRGLDVRQLAASITPVGSDWLFSGSEPAAHEQRRWAERRGWFRA